MALSRILPALAIASIATTAVVSAQNPQMLVFGHRYDHESLDANAGDLGKFGAFDAAAVVPGANATAFMFLPGTGLNTVIGDIDGDGKRANFAGQMDSDPRDSLIYFMKHSDKANPRSSNLFFTVSEIYTTNASRPAAEQVTVLKGGKPYVLKNGDFVRIKPGGEAEFFITEDLLFKACGVNQTGSFAKGANALVQDKDGSLYFAPNKGGIRMMGQNGLYVYDGGICYIAAKDITYDADGNVSDVTADSAARRLQRAGHDEPDLPHGSFDDRQLQLRQRGGLQRWHDDLHDGSRDRPAGRHVHQPVRHEPHPPAPDLLRRVRDLVGLAALRHDLLDP
jgi:hypothetical protein